MTSFVAKPSNRKCLAFWSLFFYVLISVLIIIDIWDMTDWLQATSVLSALLLLVYSTKDVWAADNINGLILLYNGDVEPGSIVSIGDYNLLAIAVETCLAQTVFRDLRTRDVLCCLIQNSDQQESIF